MTWSGAWHNMCNISIFRNCSRRFCCIRNCQRTWRCPSESNKATWWEQNIYSNEFCHVRPYAVCCVYSYRVGKDYLILFPNQGNLSFTDSASVSKCLNGFNFVWVGCLFFFLCIYRFCSYWFLAGGYLKMSLSSCDGGHKDNLSKPENVLTDNWSSEGIVRF